jgi:hypothetical protein
VPWRLRRTSRQAAGPRREFADPREPTPPLYRSPTLKALVSRLSSEVPHHVLDLGGASGANVEFFARFSSRMQIADLPDALASQELQALLTVDPAAAFRRLLPLSSGLFDVVLAWDLLNYLTREQCGRLAAYLEEVCKRDALVLAFVSTSREISDAPLVFKIVDEQTLLLQPRTPVARQNPRFAPAEVEHMMNGFAVVQSVLMRHGIREYLFVRR